MTDDTPGYSLKHQLPILQPQAGKLLYEFVRADHTHVRVELRDHGKWGVEVQSFLRGEFVMGRRFDSRKLAVEWAEAERPELEKGTEING